MKSIILVGLIGLVAGHPTFEPVSTNYHEDIGIVQAARIKAAEEAIDFDGSRIVGGSAAPLGRYPHLGGIVITLRDGRTSVCGSSLVSHTRALTAAHCWNDGQNQAALFELVFGSVRLFFGGLRVTTSNVKTHENWNPNALSNDIAVININRINYDSVIRAVALPNGNSQYTGLAWAAGFGKQSDWSGISTNQVMHHTQLQVVANSVCSNTFGNIVTNNHVCTSGANYQSPCGGDSGGPLTISNNGVDTMIGIVSFGAAAGCQIGMPAVFVRVAGYLDWIQRHM